MSSVSSTLGPPAVVRWAGPTTALACAWGAFAALDSSGASVTTYAAVSSPARALDLAAGLATIGAGALLWLADRRSAGALAVLLGCAWSAQDWVGREQAPELVRSTAMVASPFLLALVVHLAVAWPGGRSTRRRTRASVAAAYGLTAGVAIGQAAVREPLLDRYCWRTCTGNAFLVRSDVDAAQALAVLRLWSTVAIGLLLAVGCVRSLARASRAGRTAAAPVLAPAALVGVAEVAYAALLLRVPDEDPTAGPFVAVFGLRAAALLALAAGMALAVHRVLRTRRAVSLLAQELAGTPGPGELRDALARSLGDPRLEVAYWLEEPGCFVDQAGRPAQPHPAVDQVVTSLVRGGRLVAVVVHDRTLTRVHDLTRELGSAARLAVDNERLRAEALFRLEDLRASQARVVARSDTTRRRLERDLHDGAQQRLLTVSAELRLALADARVGDDPVLTATLVDAGEQAARALVELRELAHGIFPAILADAGLGTALTTFAGTAALAVEVRCDLAHRVLPAAETAAYAVVVGGVADAVRHGATWVTVDVETRAGQLVVELRDDRCRRDRGDLVHLVDRVGALGGGLDAQDGWLRAVIPCAS